MNITKNLKQSDCKIVGSDVYISSNIMNGNPGFLLIHAEWCGHCKHFKPIYEQLNRKLNSTKIRFPCLAIENVELEHNPILSKALKFQGFPTLKAVDQYGKVLGDYNGDRSIDELLNTVCKLYHHCVKK